MFSLRVSKRTIPVSLQLIATLELHWQSYLTSCKDCQCFCTLYPMYTVPKTQEGLFTILYHIWINFLLSPCSLYPSTDCSSCILGLPGNLLRMPLSFCISGISREMNLSFPYTDQMGRCRIPLQTPSHVCCILKWLF